MYNQETWCGRGYLLSSIGYNSVGDHKPTALQFSFISHTSWYVCMYVCTYMDLPKWHIDTFRQTTKSPPSGDVVLSLPENYFGAPNWMPEIDVISWRVGRCWASSPSLHSCISIVCVSPILDEHVSGQLSLYEFLHVYRVSNCFTTKYLENNESSILPVLLKSNTSSLSRSTYGCTKSVK